MADRRLMDPMPDDAPAAKGTKGPRLHHVAAHLVEGYPADAAAYDEIAVFGTEIEALRFMLGKPGWVYKALGNGQQFGEVEVNGL